MQSFCSFCRYKRRERNIVKERTTDNQHRKLYSKTYYPRQANLHYAECSRACAKRMFERSFYLQIGNTCCSQPTRGNMVHRAAACCRGIKLLLIRRSRLAFFARLRRFCVCALINESRLLHWCNILWMILSCSKPLGVIYRQFFVFNLLLYVLSSRERTKAPGTRKNQSQQPSAHESQATSFVRLWC